MAEKKAFDAKAEDVAIEAYFARVQQATAPAWRPEPGETLAFEVLKLKMGPDSGYGPYPIFVVKELESGDIVAIHAFHTMLRERFREMGVKPGFKGVVTYLGERVKNSAKDDDDRPDDRYHMYYAEDLVTAMQADQSGIEEGFSFD